MFSDHLFFRGSSGMLRVPAMLPASAKSFRVQCLNSTFLQSTPVSPEPLNEFFASCTIYGTGSRHNFISGAAAAEKIRELFSLGRRAPANGNGKEDAPC